MKYTLKQIVESRDYYKFAVKNRKERIQKYKEMNAPEIILKNEKRLLKELERNLTAFDFALDLYEQGFYDGRDNNTKRIKIIHSEENPESRLVKAIFGYNSKYLKGEDD